MAPEQVHILLLDDHKVIRDGIKALLFGHSVYRVEGAVGTSDEFFEFFPRERPTICILDVHLAGSSGLDVAKWLKHRYPNVKILIMTALHDIDVVRQCRALAIEGIISKESGKETIFEALDALRMGKSFYGGQFTDVLLKETTLSSPLSDREKDFIRAFAKGWSQKEIADYLHISPRTVEVHKKNVMEKLGLNSSVELIKYAIKEGLTSL